MKRILFTLVILCSLHLYAQEFISLWPSGRQPDFNGKKITDSLYNERIWRVATPGMYAFTVPKSENKGTTILICPGGGYERLSYIYNGFQFARYFNARGINVFILIYRLPNQQSLINRQIAPLQDAQRAMKLLKANAGKWNLNPLKIGVMGISSGGHVASMLGTHPDDVSRINDTLDNTSFRPQFMVLLSPVISMGHYAHKGSVKNFLGPDTLPSAREYYSSELHVTSFTPPTFIVHAQNDSTVPVQNSLLFYEAILAKKISASLHIFPQGAHGIKLVDNAGSTDLWLPLLDLWLKENDFVSPIK